MSIKVWVLALTLGVVALAPVLFVAYYYGAPTKIVQNQMSPPIADFKFETKTTETLEPGAEFDVLACKVIDGYRYEMYLEGDKWIVAHLTQATKDEASPVVVELLNKTTPPSPKVILRRQVADYWIVDFHLSVDGTQSKMTDVLKAKGLLL